MSRSPRPPERPGGIIGTWLATKGAPAGAGSLWAALAVSLALFAVAAVGYSPATLAQEEGAPCSWGTPDVCMRTTTCVRWAYVVWWPDDLTWTCVERRVDELYWSPVPPGSESGSVESPPDSGSEAPPGGVSG